MVCQKHRCAFSRSTTEAEQEDFIANLPVCRKIAVAFPNGFRQTCELPLVSGLEIWILEISSRLQLTLTSGSSIDPIDNAALASYR